MLLLKRFVMFSCVVVLVVLPSDYLHLDEAQRYLHPAAQMLHISRYMLQHAHIHRWWERPLILARDLRNTSPLERVRGVCFTIPRFEPRYLLYLGFWVGGFGEGRYEMNDKDYRDAGGGGSKPTN
jgi:hypothetical protein